MENNAFHSLLQLRSSAFNTEHIDQYALCFKLHAGIFEAVAFHIADKILVYYERFSLSKNFPLSETLPQLITQHPFLGAGYWKEIALLEAEYPFVQVPAEFFRADQATEILQLHSNFKPEQMRAAFVHHTAFNLVNVFGCNIEPLTILAELYPLRELQYAHVSDAILHGLHSIPEKLDYRYLHLLVNRNTLIAAFFRAGNLHLLNAYQFDTPEDFIYYVFFITTQLGLDKDETELLLWGDIGASFAGRLSILQRYFPHVSFGSRPKGLQYHYQFDDLENHAAFDLLSAYYLFA
ncbi:DUF3822 family protein [Rhodoflexus caldus]|uniref:DUF3822 family protein n=1 Tax=Rhodoflexus caldus TaxID=2891236 RepID=UPI00202A062D|nr:DUF3822 family protein [Rhodoflexus caldus]